MPFEIHDEGSFLSARLFGVLDLRDLNALVEEVERMENATPVPKDRITDLTALDRIDVGFEEVFAVAHRRVQRSVASADPLGADRSSVGSLRLRADVPDAQRQSAHQYPRLRQPG